MPQFPPTSPAILLDETRPYFLWWTPLTVGDLRTILANKEHAERSYYLGAMLRKANTRDVMHFATAKELREAWPEMARFLGRARPMWEFLLALGPYANEHPSV